MAGQVKGVLFVDYVRMLRAHRDESWVEHLQPEDLPFLESTIAPSAWYPMASFARLGLAILHSVANRDLQMVRRWGRSSVAHVAGTVEGVVVDGDPRESLMRFQVYRRSFFDFEALTILDVNDSSATIEVAYGMTPVAEEAAAWQTIGFFEGLMELSDATSVHADFTERTWEGASRTVVRLSWSAPTEG